MYVRKKIADVRAEDVILISFGDPDPFEVLVESTEEIADGRIAIHGRIDDVRAVNRVFERGFEPDNIVIARSSETSITFSGINADERPASTLVRGDVFLLKLGKNSPSDTFKIFTVVAVTPEKNVVHIVHSDGGALQEISLPAARRVRVLTSEEGAQ